jgi:hypothetical protein
MKTRNRFLTLTIGALVIAGALAAVALAFSPPPATNPGEPTLATNVAFGGRDLHIAEPFCGGTNLGRPIISAVSHKSNGSFDRSLARLVSSMGGVGPDPRQPAFLRSGGERQGVTRAYPPGLVVGAASVDRRHLHAHHPGPVIGDMAGDCEVARWPIVITARRFK